MMAKTGSPTAATVKHKKDGTPVFEWQRKMRSLHANGIKLPDKTHLVGLWLSTYIGKHKRDGIDVWIGYPGNDNLAEHCGISPRAIQPHLRKLLDVGAIEVHRPSAGKTRATEYRLSEAPFHESGRKPELPAALPELEEVFIDPEEVPVEREEVLASSQQTNNTTDHGQQPMVLQEGRDDMATNGGEEEEALLFRIDMATTKIQLREIWDAADRSPSGTVQTAMQNKMQEIRSQGA